MRYTSYSAIDYGVGPGGVKGCSPTSSKSQSDDTVPIVFHQLFKVVFPIAKSEPSSNLKLVRWFDEQFLSKHYYGLPRIARRITRKAKPIGDIVFSG